MSKAGRNNHTIFPRIYGKKHYWYVNGGLKIASSGMDYHEPQAITDHQQATVGKSKVDKFKIGTGSVRTLAEAGKVKNVIREKEKMKINFK